MTGFKDRLKKINAIRMLGTGMDVGTLNPYAHEIALYLLLRVFRREITDNPNRTRNDLIYMTEDIVKEMNLEASLEEIERLVDGILWFQDPARQEAFTCPLYNEETGEHEEFVFRYLKEDREHSHWEEGGSTVYMLTETAQEIIFITREILEEFGFDIEQFYTLQLIKSGNFNQAQNSVSNLIARVRTLIRREKDYKQDILRNPQIIFFDKKRNRRRSEEEIKEQFAEERKIFDDMFSWRDRLSNFPDDKREEGERLFEELEQARILHNQLAKLVIDNLALEVKVRVEHPDSFWQTSNLTFKKDIWQNIIVKKGLPSFDLLEDLLTPLFSPEIEFIYPLDWAWEEQLVNRVEEEFTEEEEPVEEEEKREIIPVDWGLIVDLWRPVFDRLLTSGSFSITELGDLDEIERERWLSQQKNIELFMMFVITEVTLMETEVEFEEMDERLLLFNKLCQQDDKYRKLTGKTITAVNEVEKEPLFWHELYISPYRIYIKEE
ncbi:MAG: hypothetical protein PWR10_1114 [Halanaerobiales bacterium]|nr:hypothetical protein [Halanaerobiales bacterium]